MNPGVPGMALGLYYLGGDPGQVCNAGGPQALDEVRLREGSLLWPRFPASLGMRGLTMMRVLATLNGLVNAANGGAPAAHSAYVISIMRGTYRTESGALDRFLLADGLGVGYGARPTADGIDAVYFVAQENYRSSSSRWATRCGCAPTASSGTAAARDATAAAAASCANTRSWRKKPSWPSGSTASRTRPGASPAACPAARAAPSSTPARRTSACSRRSRTANALKRGDILRIETGGGGGYGHPHDRPPAEVLEDVLGGFVSREAAERLYGVAIDGHAIDETRTAALRANRYPAKAFHRNEYVDVLS